MASHQDQHQRDQHPREHPSQPAGSHPPQAGSVSSGGSKQPKGGKPTGKGSKPGPAASGSNTWAGPPPTRQGSGGITTGGQQAANSGPPGLASQRTNASNEPPEQGNGSGGGSGPQPFPTAASVTAARSSAEQPSVAAQQQQMPPPPLIQLLHSLGGGNHQQQQQAPPRSSGPPPRPALTPTQAGIRHNAAVPGNEEGAASSTGSRPHLASTNHSPWMEIKPNPTAVDSTDNARNDGAHASTRVPGGGSAAAPVTDRRKDGAGAGQHSAGNGSSTAPRTMMARMDTDSANAAAAATLHHVGGGAPNASNGGSRGAANVVQLLSSSVGSSTGNKPPLSERVAANRPNLPPPSPAVRLTYTPDPHVALPDEVCVAPVSTHTIPIPIQPFQAVHTAGAASLPFQSSQTGPALRPSGGYAPIPHPAKGVTSESAMPFAASTPAVAAAPVAATAGVAAGIPGIPVRGYSTMLNPSAAPFGKVGALGGVTTLQDIEGVAFEKADLQGGCICCVNGTPTPSVTQCVCNGIHTPGNTLGFGQARSSDLRHLSSTCCFPAERGVASQMNSSWL